MPQVGQFSSAVDKTGRAEAAEIKAQLLDS